MKYLYLLLLLPFGVIGQHNHNCSTVSPKGSERHSMEQQLRQAATLRSQSRTTNTGMTCIPIKVHDILDGSGGGGVDKSALNHAIANLNYYFKPANIEFYICGISTYNNATYYDFSSSLESSLKTADAPVTNAFNMYLVNSIVGAAGYAYFPANSITSTTSFIDKHYLDGSPNGTVVHEFGHHFSLYHTHEGTEDGNNTIYSENVARSGINSNCANQDIGDELCDTKADPRGNTSNCVYTDGAVDIHETTYDPPVDNIMSYYPDECGGALFTAGQYGRILSALTTRQGHSTYTLNCTAASVTAASGLTATYTGSSIQLNWTDNAINETGYLIERSETSASTGFEPVINGGVADGITTFTDNGPGSYKTYYYRVKASNGNCNTYSNVASVTTGAVYCLPNYTQGCENSYLSGFTFTGNTTISNTGTSCPTEAYTNYSQTLSAEVTAGSSYSLSVTKSDLFGRSAKIYCDFNRDGDFDDAGETLASGSINGGAGSDTYTASVMIPASAYNGSSVMRVVVYSPSYNPSPTPCGDFVFGETEDYALIISGGIVSGTSSGADVNQTLSMIPNPSSGKTELRVWANESSSGTIRIISLQGDVQHYFDHTFQYGENSVDLDLTNLQAGVYLVETVIGSTSKVGKLFKF